VSRPVRSAYIGLAVDERASFTGWIPPDARIELVFGETEAGIDPVLDVSGARRAQARVRLVLDVLGAVHDVEQIPRLEPLEAQRQVVAGAIGTHQEFDDAIELSPARGVRTRHAERAYDAFEEGSKYLPVGRIEDRDTGDQLGRGGVRHQVVGDPDAVDESAIPRDRPGRDPAAAPGTRR